MKKTFVKNNFFNKLVIALITIFFLSVVLNFTSLFPTFSIANAEITQTEYIDIIVEHKLDDNSLLYREEFKIIKGKDSFDLYRIPFPGYKTVRNSPLFHTIDPTQKPELPLIFAYSKLSTSNYNNTHSNPIIYYVDSTDPSVVFSREFAYKMGAIALPEVEYIGKIPKINDDYIFSNVGNSGKIFVSASAKVITDIETENASLDTSTPGSLKIKIQKGINVVTVKCKSPSSTGGGDDDGDDDGDNGNGTDPTTPGGDNGKTPDPTITPKNENIFIAVGVIISLLVVIGGFIVFLKLVSKKKKKNNT